MDLADMKKRIGNYLLDYLPKFKEGKTEDVRFMIPEGFEVDPSQAKIYPEAEFVDLHKERYDSFMEQLGEISKAELIERISSLDDLIFVDIGNMGVGRNFALHVARNNPSIDVRIYEPSSGVEDKWPDSFFKEITPTMVTFDKRVELEGADLSGSLNRLFDANGLGNAIFYDEFLTYDRIMELSEENVDKKLLLYFDRIDEFTARALLQAVNDADNVDVIVAPVINGHQYIDSFKDKVTESVRKYEEAIRGNIGHFKKPNPVDAHARLAIAARGYLAIDLAEQINGKVYKKADMSKWDAFNMPSFYISSIDLGQKRNLNY